MLSLYRHGCHRQTNQGSGCGPAAETFCVISPGCHVASSCCPDSSSFQIKGVSLLAPPRGALKPLTPPVMALMPLPANTGMAVQSEAWNIPLQVSQQCYIPL